MQLKAVCVCVYKRERENVCFSHLYVVLFSRSKPQFATVQILSNETEFHLLLVFNKYSTNKDSL